MAYDTLTAAQIAAGKALKEEILTKIKANQDSFNNDIQLLQGTSKVDVFDIKFTGDIENYTTSEIQDKNPVFKAPTAATLVSFVITLLETSTSGTLEIDLQKSTDDGVNWNTVLTSTVTLTGTTVGSLSGSVTFSSDTYAQNDLLRLKIDGIQVGQGNFHVSVYSEVS